MRNFPFNKPICLRGHTGNNLQNEFFWSQARCNNTNTEGWEQLIFLQTSDKKVIIQSRWNQKNLQVQPSGNCVFANHNQLLWEQFDVEWDDHGEKIFFRSCHTGNYMQCDQNGFVTCANQNKLGWEAWEMIDPTTTEMLTSAQLKENVENAAVAVGVLIPIFTEGVVFGALIPFIAAGCLEAINAFHV